MSEPYAGWPRVRRLTVLLLLAWAFVAFVPIYFARELNFELFGWPFGFWIASQGALLAFLAIVVIYARGVTRIEGEAGD
jgi:putative solute:sodium symporter small subunit